MTDVTTETGACACGGDGGCGSNSGETTASSGTTASPEVTRGERTELPLAGAAPAVTELAPGAEEGDLDVRDIPREFRHDRVIGQVTSLVPGEAVVLAAPHAPVPLLNQIEREVAGDFSFEYLLEGPEVWRVAITRDTCC